MIISAVQPCYYNFLHGGAPRIPYKYNRSFCIKWYTTPSLPPPPQSSAFGSISIRSCNRCAPLCRHRPSYSFNKPHKRAPPIFSKINSSGGIENYNRFLWTDSSHHYTGVSTPQKKWRRDTRKKWPKKCHPKCLV